MLRKLRVIFLGLLVPGELEGVPLFDVLEKDESMEFILELGSRGKKNPCPLSEPQDKDPVEFTELLESCRTRRGLELMLVLRMVVVLLLLFFA